LADFDQGDLMTIKIKELNVEMEVKNKGVEFEIRDAQDNFLGDLIVKKSGVIWCKGKTTAKNGVEVKWADFISMIEKS
jgi:hypothetical protein